MLPGIGCWSGTFAEQSWQDRERKKSTNPSFWVWISSGGRGSSTRRGGDQKVRYVPGNQGNQTFFGGISRDFAGISRRCLKSLRKSLFSIFGPYRNDLDRALIWLTANALIRRPHSTKQKVVQGKCPLHLLSLIGPFARTLFSCRLLPWPMLSHSGQILHSMVLKQLVWSNTSAMGPNFGGLLLESGKKKARKHKLFCPVGLGTTPGLSREFHRACPRDRVPPLPGENLGQTQVFSLFYTLEARFHRVCPWDKPGLPQG